MRVQSSILQGVLGIWGILNTKEHWLHVSTWLRKRGTSTSRNDNNFKWLMFKRYMCHASIVWISMVSFNDSIYVGLTFFELRWVNVSLSCIYILGKEMQRTYWANWVCHSSPAAGEVWPCSSPKGCTESSARRCTCGCRHWKPWWWEWCQWGLGDDEKLFIFWWSLLIHPMKLFKPWMLTFIGRSFETCGNKNRYHISLVNGVAKF